MEGKRNRDQIKALHECFARLAQQMDTTTELLKEVSDNNPQNTVGLCYAYMLPGEDLTTNEGNGRLQGKPENVSFLVLSIFKRLPKFEQMKILLEIEANL